MFKQLPFSPIQIIVSIVLLLIIMVVAIQFTAQEKVVNTQTEQKLIITPEFEAHSDHVLGAYETHKLDQLSANDSLSRQTQALSELNSGSVDINSFSNLDDESLLTISDILENSLVPVFLADGDAGEKAAALDVFISRLPEGMNASDFKRINSLLRDYLPYDLADELTEATHEKYRSYEQEQAYLVATLPDNKLPKTMAEQIAIAEHLESFKQVVATENQSDDAKQADLELNQALSTWQQTEEKLNEIASSPDASEQTIHQIIADEYDAKVADDYIELSMSEKQWQEKYAAFLVEKNIIIESGLSAEDKAEQVESLIKEHYQENEWAAARGYDEMMQAKPES